MLYKICRLYAPVDNTHQAKKIAYYTPQIPKISHYIFAIFPEKSQHPIEHEIYESCYK